MTTTDTYNGWTNYETWAVKLWIDNEEHFYHYWREVAQAVWDQAEEGNHSTRQQNAQYQLCQILKSEHEDEMPELKGVWADLLGAAMQEVDWYEIAQAMIEEAQEAAQEV